MRSLPLTALSLTLGFFFIFVGSLKITPKVNPDMYNDLKREFGRFNKVFPFYKYTGWRPYAKNYRLFIGLSELICGLVLVLIPGPLKEIANVLLIIMMVGGFFTHYTLNDRFDRMAPALVFTLLLLCRLLIAYQVSKRERKELDEFNKLVEQAQQENEKQSEEEKEEEEEAKTDKIEQKPKENGTKSKPKNKVDSKSTKKSN